MQSLHHRRPLRRSAQHLRLEVLEERQLLSSYTITDLGPGGANGINDSGLVGGGGDHGPFTWDSVNGRQDLEIFGVHDLSAAVGVSPQGLIVGDAPTPLPGNPEHAFLYHHGKVTDLGTLGGRRSAAFGVNDAGQVVGFSSTKGIGFDHAFLWDGQNGMQDLGTLGGLVSAARGINGSGLVVGESDLRNGTRHAFVWDSKNGMRDIGGISFRSNAVGVNDAGQVVGSMNNDAFLYDGGTLTDLGNLGGVAVGNAINDAGIIVGGSGTGGTGYMHGFIYRDGAMTDLTDLIPPDSGLTIVAAQGINNAGQIVGVAAQDGDFNPHAILLIPDGNGGPASAVFRPPASSADSPSVVDTAVAPKAFITPIRPVLETAAALPAESTMRQVTDAVFANSHRSHIPAVWVGGEGQATGLQLFT
jgi:probable HAF family extracellular repeat protein